MLFRKKIQKIKEIEKMGERTKNVKQRKKCRKQWLQA